MSTILLQVLQTAGLIVAPRRKAIAMSRVCAGTTAAYGKGRTANGTAGTWLATSRLSMHVPAFHDRRPLCSPT
jgi:hypothetical protein